MTAAEITELDAALRKLAQKDPMSIFEEDALRDLLRLRDASPAAWMRLRNNLKEAGVPLGELAKALKQVERRLLDAERVARRTCRGVDMSGLPEIIVSSRARRDVVTEAIDALRVQNDPAMLFHDDRGIVRIARAGERPIIELLTDIMLSDHLDRAANFLQRGRGGVLNPTEPPPNVVRVIDSRRDPAFPRLVGLTESPILRPDGTILTTSGYDAATQCFYAPRPGFSMTSVATHPDAETVAGAVRLIVEDLLIDFPFLDEASRANAIALLLTTICRPAISGLIPLALLDKPSPGTGATLLANLTSYVATGEQVAIFPASRSEEEWRKWLTSVLLTGAPLVLIDNVTQRLASSSLLAALTAGRWADRLLGGNTIAHLPQRATWMVTGNNLSLGTDMARRAYLIRLDARLERPADRPPGTFKHTPIEGWVLERRGDLLAALFTLVRAWFAAGCPKPTIPTLGGFIEWTTMIGGTLEVAGVRGFLGNIPELYADLDDESREWDAFIEVWYRELGSEPLTVTVLREDGGQAVAALRTALPQRLLDALEGRRGDFGTRVGNALKSRKDRVYRISVEGTPRRVRLERAGKDSRSRAVCWRVRPVDDGVAEGREERPEKDSQPSAAELLDSTGFTEGAKGAEGAEGAEAVSGTAKRARGKGDGGVPYADGGDGSTLDAEPPFAPFARSEKPDVNGTYPAEASAPPSADPASSSASTAASTATAQDPEETEVF